MKDFKVMPGFTSYSVPWTKPEKEKFDGLQISVRFENGMWVGSVNSDSLRIDFEWPSLERVLEIIEKAALTGGDLDKIKELNKKRFEENKKKFEDKLEAERQKYAKRPKTIGNYIKSVVKNIKRSK